MAERKGAVPGPSGPMGRATTPDKNCSPPRSRNISLKELTETSVEHFYERYLHGTAQKKNVAPEELSPTLQHTLRVAAKKAASKRVTLIRNGAKERKLRPKLEAPSKAKAKSPSKHALLEPATELPLPPNDPHNLESSTSSSHHTKAQTSFGMTALPTLYGHELGSDELEQLRSYSPGGVSHPQLLNDVIVPEGDPFMDNDFNSQGGRGSLFEPARMNHHMASSPPSGSFQIQNLAAPSPGNHFANKPQVRNQFNQFNQLPTTQRPITQASNMTSPQSLAFPATAEDGNRNQDIVIPSTPRYHVQEAVDQASDMISPQSQFMQAVSGHGNQGQEFNARPPSRLTLDPARINPRVYDPIIADNPFENEGPPKSLADVTRRARFHTNKLNILHLIRKQDNERISYNYVMQGSWLCDALGDYLTMVTGLRTTSDLLVAYSNDPQPQKFIHLARWVQCALIPKLENMGPNLKAVLATATKVIQDPEFRQSCAIHVLHAFYLSFCGIKTSLLIMDRHRQDHPEEWPAGLGSFKFENIFRVTRQMVWTWLMPDEDDHILGEHDHYFTLQGPPADPEDMLAPLTTAADEKMT